jgi:hypothetical protein
LETEDYEDFAEALSTFTSIRELNLSFESNEMGDECLEILSKGYAEYEYLEKVTLNLNRNDLTAGSLCGVIHDMGELGMLKSLMVQAKKNVRKVDQKDMVKKAMAKLMLKNKKVVM